MNLTRTLNRNSALFFGLFLASAVLAFWPGYLSQIFLETDVNVHIHGALLTTWLAMLVSQAFLVRSRRLEIHRQIGKLSYVIGPAVFLSIISIVHNGMSQNAVMANVDFLNLAKRLGFALLFGLAYGMAMYHRGDSATHGRYMLCTVLPMTGPIFNRILLIYVAPVVDFLPRFEGARYPGYLTSGAADVLLAGLSVWDWKVHRRLNVFPVMLGAYLILQVFAFSVYDVELWQIFSRWFLQLPLS